MVSWIFFFFLMQHRLKRIRKCYSKVSGHLTQCSVKWCNLHWIWYLVTTIKCSVFFFYRAFLAVMAKLFLLIKLNGTRLYFGWWRPNRSQEKQVYSQVNSDTYKQPSCVSMSTNKQLKVVHFTQKGFRWHWVFVFVPPKWMLPSVVTPHLNNLSRIPHFICSAFQINTLHRGTKKNEDPRCQNFK